MVATAAMVAFTAVGGLSPASSATTTYDLSTGLLDTDNPFTQTLSGTPSGLLTISSSSSFSGGVIVLGGLTGPANQALSGSLFVKRSYYDNSGTINVGQTLEWSLAGLALGAGSIGIIDLSTELVSKTFGSYSFSYDPTGDVGVRYETYAVGLPAGVTTSFGAVVFGPSTIFDPDGIIDPVTPEMSLSAVTAVPETSTSLLGAIGALAFLRRRR